MTQTTPARKRAWYLANKERLKVDAKLRYDARTDEQKEQRRIYAAAHYKKNKKRQQAQHKIWYEANKEKILLRQKTNYEADKERIQARNRAWYSANKERIAVWRKEHKKEQAVKRRAYYERKKEHISSHNRIWRENNLAKIILRSAWNRAKQFNLLFNLTLDDIVIPAYCPIFGLPLERKMRLQRSDNNPVLDRIIPEKGYVKGNVAVISDLANRIKSNGSATQHRRIAEWIDEMTDGQRE